MEMYKLASQMKLRFQSTKGELTTEQLWDVSIEDLDKILVSLYSEVKGQTDKVSFLIKATKKSEITKLKFDIAFDVFNSRIEEANKLSTARIEKERKDKILAVINRKKEGLLEEMSIEELEAML